MDTSPRLSTTNAGLWTLVNMVASSGVIVNSLGSTESLLGDAGAPLLADLRSGTPILQCSLKLTPSLRHSVLCGQAHLFPETPVKCSRGNEAPEQTDLARGPSGGVAASLI